MYIYTDRQVRVDVKSDAGSHIASFLPNAYELIIPYKNLTIPDFDAFRKRLIGMNELTKGHNYDSWFNAAVLSYEKKVKTYSALSTNLTPPPTSTPTTYTPNDEEIENIILSLLTSWYALYIVQCSSGGVGSSGVGTGVAGGGVAGSGSGVVGEVKLAGICRKGANEQNVLITVLIDANR